MLTCIVELDLETIKQETGLETYLDRHVVIDSDGTLLGASFERLAGWYVSF